MHVFKTKQELNAFVIGVKSKKRVIGFVPTMGALHQGHLSLVAFSKADNDLTIASIFVNPTQFNNADDLKNYPRNLDLDLDLLEKSGCDAVFVPDEREMYPESDTRVFDFDGIDRLMEGQFRPGHFNGVAQIVSKLFEAVNPHRAYFGQKDFQQVAILRKMVEKLHFPIEIIACPIVREPDGLAMSSRNQLLSVRHRKAAPLIYETLKQSAEKWNEFKNREALQQWVVDEINKNELLKVEYFEIVSQKTLESPEQNTRINGLIGCVAVWADKVRLIDNFIYNY